jgi:MFS family permease
MSQCRMSYKYTYSYDSLLGYFCDIIGPRPISLLASILFASSYTLAGKAFANHFPLWTFLVAFFLVGMATGALYFSALTTSAKNCVGHRGLSIAIPAAAFGLSSFWEAMLAGSHLFTKEVKTEVGGVISRELDVVRLFNFFAVLLGIVGVIGAFGLIIVPQDLSKKVECEDATEEDALLPRAEGSQTNSANGVVPPQEGLTAENRPFFAEATTYLFCLVLVVLLGSGEMYINCVCFPEQRSNDSWEQCYKHYDQVLSMLLPLILADIYLYLRYQIQSPVSLRA